MFGRPGVDNRSLSQNPDFRELGNCRDTDRYRINVLARGNPHPSDDLYFAEVRMWEILEYVGET